jgi:hypothetical protein
MIPHVFGQEEHVQLKRRVKFYKFQFAIMSKYTDTLPAKPNATKTES